MYESVDSECLTTSTFPTVCCGANGKFDDLLTTYNKIVHWFHEMNNETQLGAFILRRVPKLIDKDTGRPYAVLYYRLLVYELLYLWNAMPSCSSESLRGIMWGNRDRFVILYSTIVQILDDRKIIVCAQYNFLHFVDYLILIYQNVREIILRNRWWV